MRAEFFSNIRAITPATHGVACDVPDFWLYLSTREELRLYTKYPGALMSGRMRPIDAPEL